MPLGTNCMKYMLQTEYPYRRTRASGGIRLCPFHPGGGGVQTYGIARVGLNLLVWELLVMTRSACEDPPGER